MRNDKDSLTGSFLLFVACSSLTTGESLYHTFWVTPSTEQVCGNRTPCDTIDGYYNQAKDIFSTSNAAWIFLNGHHQVSNMELRISLTENVTLKGFEGNIHIEARAIVITKSSNISIANVNLLSYRLFINVSGFFVSNSSIKISVYFLLANPTGIYHIKNCTIRGTFEIFDYQDLGNVNTESELLNLKIEDTYFTSSLIITFHTSVNYARKVGVAFKRCIVPGMIITMVRYPQEGFELSFLDCLILGDVNILLIQICHTSIYNPSESVKVTIHNCHFQKRFAENIEFSIILAPGPITDSHYSSLSQQCPVKIKISDTIFVGTTFILRNSIPDIPKSREKHNITIHNCTFRHYHGLTEETNDVAISNYVLVLHDLHFPVVMSDCKIIDNKAGAIFMSYSKLQLRGHNVIRSNTLCNDKLCNGNRLTYVSHCYMGIIALSCSAVLLLENGSQLTISHNHLYYPYGTIVLSPTLKRSLTHYSTVCNDMQHMQDYRDQTYSAGFDGKCFFQLVDEQGQFMEKDHIENFNGSITFSNNTYFFPNYKSKNLPKEIYNGHLYNCILQTRESTNIVDTVHLKKFIHISHMKSAVEIERFQSYQICLCGYTVHAYVDLKNRSRSSWNCSGQLNLTMHPGEESIILYISTVNDFGEISDGSKVEIDCNCNISYSIEVYIDQECKNITVPKIPIHLNQTTLRLRLETRLPVQTHRLFPKERYYSVYVVNILRCPFGFKEDLNTMKCECGRFLINHHFECQLTKLGGIDYKQVLFDTYWIGLQIEDLVLSDFCLRIFCNSLIKRGGVSLDELNSSNNNNKQCNEENGRIGFVCSECPPGYSSVFGGYTCTQCNGPWFILFIPLHVLAGLALVALLFLFNLTIVQGTINGISLYANIMYLYYDDLQDYARKPFYKIISLLNFGSEFEICLYDGMNEFTKAMLLFSFPFYLLLIVVLIIIGAHKFNLKIFKVEFIAKRAVPVLATLMVLTYTNLIGLVIHALRYTNIYTHNTLTEEETTYRVWLYQPRLRYFEKEHLALGLLAVTVTVLYLIPLTVVTLFGDLLRRNCIRSLWFSHFLDVFHGAYRWPLGFWLGLRLLLRLLLMLISTLLKRYTYTFILIFTCILFTFEILLLKPFHGRFQSNQDFIKNRISRVLKWFLNPVNVDGLFLMNIIFFSGILGLNFNENRSVALGVFCNISTLLVVIKICFIMAAHGWMFFPVSKYMKETWLRFKAVLQKKEVKEHEKDVNSTVADCIQQFPFHDIHHLKAGLPQENESSDEDETSFSQSGDGSVHTLDHVSGDIGDPKNDLPPVPLESKGLREPLLQ